MLGNDTTVCSIDQVQVLVLMDILASLSNPKATLMPDFNASDSKDKCTGHKHDTAIKTSDGFSTVSTRVRYSSVMLILSASLT